MKQRSLRILFTAAEVAPFVKAGGLADVAGALPKALARLGCDTRVVMPSYAEIDLGHFGTGDPIASFTVPFGGARHTVRVFQTRLPDSAVPVYLLQESHYISKGALYFHDVGDEQERLRQETARYLFFCQAALYLPATLGWTPDIIHCHDWHTGAIPFLLRRAHGHPELRLVKSLYTIHNLGLQGWCDFSGFTSLLGIRGSDSMLERLRRRDGGINLAALGILASTMVNTVSPSYAQEILTQEYGVGLDDLLRERKADLFGILNGIDDSKFDPTTDPHIQQRYGTETLPQKTFNKVWLKHHAGLTNNGPVFGIVSRLTEQKGILLVCEIISRLVELGIGLTILGSGERTRERTLLALAERFPHAVSVRLGFDAVYAQRIYAGSDCFLMPSRFEPCGLGQMISMRYGTIPVVRATGGLRDTVTEGENGVGFVFQKFTADDLLAACKRSLAAFQQRDVWRALQRRGMEHDFSWDTSASAYQRLYLLTQHANTTKE